MRGARAVGIRAQQFDAIPLARDQAGEVREASGQFMVVRLVAHHSLAAMEAPFYGVGHHLGVIEAVPGIDADILISADLRAGTGNPAPTVDMRLEEMSRLDEELGLVPPDVRQARYAGLRSAHERILGLT